MGKKCVFLLINGEIRTSEEYNLMDLFKKNKNEVRVYVHICRFNDFK